MKKNNKKGFTLIELLAVIIILAVIALIATPLIMNIIESSRKKAFENSVYGVMSAYDIKTMKYENYKGVIYNFPEGNNELKYSGTKMTEGSIFLSRSGNIEVRRITDGRYCANGNKTNIIVKKGDCTVDLANIPIIRKSTSAAMYFIGVTSIRPHDIESVDIIMVSSFPEGAIDVSDKGNRSVMLWSKDENSNGRLEVYIGAIGDMVYANPDSQQLFSTLENANRINLENFSASTATKTGQMFSRVGTNSPNFILDLGYDFDTSNVTHMGDMFTRVGSNSTNFTLDLGDKFDTSKVTNMSCMFCVAGSNSQNFRLNLGNKFDTSKATIMDRMFYYTGNKDTNFSLNLGSKFDTSKVTNMNTMFYHTGESNSSFVLDLGSKFSTGEVIYYTNTFSRTGYSNPLFKPTASVKTQAEKDAILSKFPNIEVTIKP